MDEIEAPYVDNEDPTVSGPWQITTVTSLDWAMSRLAALQLELADLADQERARVEAIERRAAALADKVQCGVAFFEAKIEEYAHSHREALLGGGKKKSRDVLSGTVGWRTKPGKLVVTNKLDLEAWLERQPPEAELCRVRLEPNMAALKALYKANGTIPPGCSWEEESETFHIEPMPLVTDIVNGDDRE